jgi:hypothetical protein
MKIDPYNHKKKYLAWKEKIKENPFIEGVSDKNSGLIIKYVFDMEIGLNVSSFSVKGSRSPTRLNNLRQRLSSLFNKLESLYDLKDITLIQEEQITDFFHRMRNGELKRLDGKTYLSVVDFVKIFKAFWHWWQTINRKKGIEILDVTRGLDTSKYKPKWVYLTEREVIKLADNARYDYKVLILFLFETGIRAPTELINIKVRDLSKNFKELNIRDEISKTFGRRIKIIHYSELLKEYVMRMNLDKEDYLFSISPKRANEYLKRLANKIFGEEISEGGEKYCKLTMYDLRHCSCCYWLPIYKSESALKYRFGWKKSDKIHYYSELIGMRDTITEEDLLIDVTRTEIEQNLEKTQKENEILKDQLRITEEKINEMSYWIERIKTEMGLQNTI